MQMENSIAYGITNKTTKQRQNKAMEKKFYWLQDRVQQGESRLEYSGLPANKILPIILQNTIHQSQTEK